MLYKRPIIALTSLLDLLFILIFAYQMDIKTNADEYVQAEVEKRISLDIPDQRELVAELQVENESIKAELIEANRELEKQIALDMPDQRKLVKEMRAENESVKVVLVDAIEKMQLLRTQRDQLRDELKSLTEKTNKDVDDRPQLEEYKRKMVDLENKILLLKYDNMNIKKQPKSNGAKLITAKDAEITKMLVGTWDVSYDISGFDNSEPPITELIATKNSTCVYKKDGKYYENGIKKAVTDIIEYNQDAIVIDTMKKGQTKSYNLESNWWIEGGLLYIGFKDNGISNAKISKILFINQQEYNIKTNNGLVIGVGVRIK
jgi:hypothetical protein